MVETRLVFSRTTRRCVGAAGLLGVGGGFLIVPALTELGGLPMDRAIGTSLFVITLQASMGALGYLAHASVRWDVVPVLALVMALGSTAGGLLSKRISVAALRPCTISLTR